MSFVAAQSNKLQKDEEQTSNSMVNHYAEKKCCLVARFYAEDLDGYDEKVRDNLSLYLNTAEKIRLRVTKNSLTVSDRTIWHNKLERIPISLMKECKVDAVSPKICYFVNETILHRYQIMAVLCKNINDSHKLVSCLQYHLLSSSHYRSHNNWLNNGRFDQPVHSPARSRTLANDDRKSTSHRSSFRLHKKGCSLPAKTNGILLCQTSGNSSVLLTTVNSVEAKEQANLKDDCEQMVENFFQRRPSTATSSRQCSAKEDKCTPLPPTDTYLGSCGNEVFYQMEEELLPLAPTQSTSILGEEDFVPTSAQSENKQSESDVVLRKKKIQNCARLKGHETRSALVMRDAIRSSIIQYASDDEDDNCTTSEDNIGEKLHHNAEGIASLDVGGNATLDSTNPEEISDAQSPSEQPQLGPDNLSEGLPESNSAHLDNLLDGVYDNIRCLNETMDVSAENINKLDPDKELPIGKSVDPAAENESDEDEDYQLVLAGLTQLTRSTGGAKSIGVETRYPHQVAAAMSTKQTHINPPSQPQSQNPTILVQPPSVDQSQNITPVLKRRIENMSGSIREKPSRPQSVVSGIQIVKATEARRSTRRKGQYQSIAEYEKSRAGKRTVSGTPITITAVTRVSGGNNGTSSVYSSMPIICDDGTTGVNESSNKCMNLSVGSLTSNQVIQDNHCKRTSSFLSVDSGHAFNHSKISLNKESRITGEDNDYNRRSSMISLSSVPNNIIHLRRVSTENLKPTACQPERNDFTFDRMSKSFDRKSLRAQLQDRKGSSGGLQIVGSSNNVVYSQQNGGLSKVPVIDGRLQGKLDKYRGQPVPVKSHLCWSPIQMNKRVITRGHFVPLPDAPNMRYTKRTFHLQTDNGQNLDGTWETNPGFKRFFESIMTYGPNGSQPSVKNLSPLSNQPDIVLESLTPDHTVKEDDSDEASSIRSSASAYWPSELKAEAKTMNNSEEFEETASWKFHSPLMMVKQRSSVQAM